MGLACRKNPPEDAPPNIMRCRMVQCGPYILTFHGLEIATDKNAISEETEEDAYWAEIEENATMGGPGFRD